MTSGAVHPVLERVGHRADHVHARRRRPRPRPPRTAGPGCWLRNSSTTAAWALRSSPSKRGVQTCTLADLQRGRRAPASPPPPVASFIFSAWISRSCAFSCVAQLRVLVDQAAPVRLGRLLQLLEDPLVLPARAASAASPVSASTRRVPAETPCSAVNRKSPISPVWCDVGAAAELLGEARAPRPRAPLAVLVAEEGQRAVGEGLLAAHDLRAAAARRAGSARSRGSRCGAARAASTPA